MEEEDVWFLLPFIIIIIIAHYWQLFWALELASYKQTHFMRWYSFRHQLTSTQQKSEILKYEEVFGVWLYLRAKMKSVSTSHSTER